MFSLITKIDGQQALALAQCPTTHEVTYRDGIVYQGMLSCNVEIWHVPGFNIYVVLRQTQIGELPARWQVASQHTSFTAARQACREILNAVRQQRV